MTHDAFIGTAGWAIPARHAGAFPTGGTHLERYASRLNAVEINSSFYRPHRHATYARWAASVPDAFRFAVKLPKAITHERHLVGCHDLLFRFAEEVAGLGPKLGVLLVQLPPSLPFDEASFRAVVAALRARLDAPIACEPRHPSWFTSAAQTCLVDLQVARVGADPPPAPGAGDPGGWPGLAYLRLHGAPRIYYSDYGDDALAAVRRRLTALRAAGATTWCIFDNTAAFHALGNALSLQTDGGKHPQTQAEHLR